jgi:hypothetical protein
MIPKTINYLFIYKEFGYMLWGEKKIKIGNTTYHKLFSLYYHENII